MRGIRSSSHTWYHWDFGTRGQELPHCARSGREVRVNRGQWSGWKLEPVAGITMSHSIRAVIVSDVHTVQLSLREVSQVVK